MDSNRDGSGVGLLDGDSVNVDDPLLSVDLGLASDQKCGPKVWIVLSGQDDG